MPTSAANLQAMSVEDLDAIRRLLASDVTSYAAVVLHLGANYKNGYEKLAEINRIRLNKLRLDGGSNDRSVISTFPNDASAGPSTSGSANQTEVTSSI